MTDQPPQPAPRPPSSDSFNGATVVYILYLLGFVLAITPLVGLIMAYVNRSTADAWLQSHYTFQIRTFWIGCLYTLIGVVLMIVLVGFLILLFAAVWMIVRCIQGLMASTRGDPIPDPKTWWFV